MKQCNCLVESFSGVRGVYGQSITSELAYRYAFCYCRFLKRNNLCLVIGGDTRSSTLVLKKTMVKAFRDCGVKKIIDVGVVPIQVCEYAVLKFKANGGIYITASHNEPEYNGWKILKQDGALLYPEQVDKLIKMVHNNQECKPVFSNAKADVVNKNKEAIDNYINFVLERIGKTGISKIRKSDFKMLADPNGGSAIVILDKLFKKLGVKVRIVNNKLGKFERLIEPNIKSLNYLIPKMRRESFEFACGFDCDADRVELVLPPDSEFSMEMGSVLSGQYVLALACDERLKGTKNQVVVTNDCTSYLVRNVIKQYKAKTKEVEVGEMNVVREMEKQKSIVGGEGSNGGVIIPPIKCRDGIMTIALILKMIAEREESLSDILQEYPKYYSERTKVKCFGKKLREVKQGIEKYFGNKGYQIQKTGDYTGGLKVMFDKNSYVWFRFSKTEAGVFRIIADGDGQKKVKNMLKDGIEVFKKFKK